MQRSGFISGADSEITPVRIMFEHKGKIFAAHKRFHLPTCAAPNSDVATSRTI
jgi:hypothetical protein